MDIKWRQENNFDIHLSNLLNSLVVLLAPDSGHIIYPLLNLNIYLSRELTYNDYESINSKFNTIPGNTYIDKMLFLMGTDSSFSFFYIKINVNGTEIAKFSNDSSSLDIEPKEIKLSPETKLFGINYKFEHFKLNKNIKIQETFGEFKLNSIYVELDKPYSIFKVNKIWFLYDDQIGVFNINFNIFDNIIYFDTVELNNKLFCFSQAKSCTLFYLKVSKSIDPFEECDCRTDIGWLQKDKFCLGRGICWFDAGMMSLMIPLKSRKLFLKPMNKKFKIPEVILFPCRDSLSTPNKYKIIRAITQIEPNTELSDFQIIFSKLYPLISDSILLDYSSNHYTTLIRNIPLLVLTRHLSEIPSLIEPQAKIFCIDIRPHIQGFKILNNYKNYSLISLNITIDNNGNHNVAFINCIHGWFFYDNNLAAQYRPMIPIETQIHDNAIYFRNFSYSYLDGNPDIYINLTNTKRIILVYCL